MNVVPHIPPRILVAGIGNIFLGDDAFGCEVAQHLLARPHPLPAGHPAKVRIADFGIRGLDLVYALQECDTLILIDAVPRGEGPPGTLYVLEPQLDAGPAAALIDPHSLDPVKVLRTAAAMGAQLRTVRIVACEPATRPDDFDHGEAPIGLSAPVAAAVDEAVLLVDSLINRLSGPFAADPAAALKENHACPL